MPRIYIFGAHSRAQTLAAYIKVLGPSLVVEAFLVNNDEENAQEISGIPVYHIDACKEINFNYPVYLGVRGTYHDKLTKILKEKGFDKIIPLTAELDIKLRNRFLELYYKKKGRKFPKLECEDAGRTFCIYEARSELDRPIQSNICLSNDYEKGIQVGAALSSRRLEGCVFRDDEGDNISLRNKQFCETTALYWIWKNAKEDIVGMVHYRRHFLLPPDWKERMLFNQIDVILPTPLYVAPSVGENYQFRHDRRDWDYMMEYLKKHHKMEYVHAVRFFSEGIFSPCNMFIMRKEILDEYCKWLFPILFAVADYCGEKDDAYQNRYPAFMGERLMSLFFEINRNHYKIVYCDKNFLK